MDYKYQRDEKMKRITFLLTVLHFGGSIKRLIKKV